METQIMIAYQDQLNTGFVCKVPNIESWQLKPAFLIELFIGCICRHGHWLYIFLLLNMMLNKINCDWWVNSWLVLDQWKLRWCLPSFWKSGYMCHKLWTLSLCFSALTPWVLLNIPPRSLLLRPPSYDLETNRAQPSCRTSQFSNCTVRRRGPRSEEASWGVRSITGVSYAEVFFGEKTDAHINSPPPSNLS